MITPEDFSRIKEDIDNGSDITPEDIKSLVDTIYEMDTQLVILQNALQLAVDNSQEVIPAVAEKVLSLSGRTDTKIKKKVAQYAADVTARYEIAVHLYLAGAADKAREMLSGTPDISEETTQEVENGNNQ
jgi:hypothetical protein